VVVSERVAASAVPVLGAVGGATINMIFMDHFERIARGHFALRRLERMHGQAEVRRLYSELRQAVPAQLKEPTGERTAHSGKVMPSASAMARIAASNEIWSALTVDCRSKASTSASCSSNIVLPSRNWTYAAHGTNLVSGKACPPAGTRRR